MRPKHQFLLILCLIFINLLFSPHARGFIHREFTTHEILDASTNIVFGRVKSVDTKRMTAIINVEEDIKGKSDLAEIKLNIAVGRYMPGSSPEKMINLLKTGMSVIIFYQKTYRIEGLGYMNGTWFRARTRAPSGWWSYTHICPYMLRTFKGTATEFREALRSILAGEKWVGAPKNAVKVLVLTGNSTRPIPIRSPVPVSSTVSYEYSAIRSVHKVRDLPMVYESTRNRSLTDLDGIDILWLGQEEIAADEGYLLNKAIEEKIKRFVKNGGVVIVSGQDSDPERPVGMGWLAANLKGIELQQTQDFKITKHGKKLFAEPNQIQPGQIYADDGWTDWDKDFKILATTRDGKDLIVGVRKHGKGLYIITSLRNDAQFTVRRNEKLIENLLYYATDWLR